INIASLFVISELSQKQQNHIISTYLCGFRPLHIAQALDFPKSIVYDTVNQYNETGSEHLNKCPGYQEVLSECNKCALVRIANNNHRALLAVIMNELNFQVGITLTTKTTQKYLYNLDWVPYSSDLNLIKNLWKHLDSMLHNRNLAPKTHEELVMCIKEEWYKISL
ncbi:37679_t:CDS:2, partial [Gigaspora margarita]